MANKVGTALYSALAVLLVVAACSSLYGAVILHRHAPVDLGHYLWQVLRLRTSTVAMSQPEKERWWSSSSVENVDESFCLGDAFCEANSRQNVVLKNVRFQQNRLILHGVNASDPLLERIPLTTFFREDQFELQVSPQTDLDTEKECDAILADHPVIIDYPYHCNNIFHVHNDNIFKHLATADMVQMSGSLDQVTVLQRRRRCKRLEILEKWYSVFKQVSPLAVALHNRTRLCVKTVLFSQKSFEIFNRYKMKKKLPVPLSRISFRLVNLYREIFISKIRKMPLHDKVDRTSAEGKLVLFLGRNNTLKFREVRYLDKLRIKESFLRRGLRFEILQTNDQYQDLNSLWSKLAEAAILMGPHGAALTNAVYVRRNALLVELRTRYSRHVRYFETMSTFLGLQHVDVDLRDYSDGKVTLSDQDIEIFADNVIAIFETRVSTRTNSVYNMMPFVNASLFGGIP